MPDWELKTNVGQSYRLDSDRDIFPVGTGLSERFSDFVGRTEVRYKDFLRFTHRFRLDKDNLAIRRNEIDATVGSSKTYAELGYVRLDRDITDVEDLQDREELRGAVRISFANYWSLFGRFQPDQSRGRPDARIRRLRPDPHAAGGGLPG